MMKSFVRITSLGAVLSVAIAGGCTNSIYNHGSSANVSPSSGWTITGDLSNLRSAIDDNLNTAATSSSTYSSAFFTIDLGKPCVFNTVVVDHGQQLDGYCRRTAVYLSMDGRNFRYQYAVPGVRRVTTLNWVTPVMARYVRVQAIAPGDRPWSVAEVYIR